MEEKHAIEVTDLVISYQNLKKTSIKKNLLHFNRQKADRFVAVKGISFYVREGEILGIIGKNGCGKSTTLNALAGIFSPDSGTIDLHGHSISLLSIGVGFQREMTGRENITLSGMLLGFSEEQVKEKEAEIVEFAELGDFIDMPVRTYSSGMYSKLAFSITAILETDIMLIDEVLSVGDQKFKKKKLRKNEKSDFQQRPYCYYRVTQSGYTRRALRHCYVDAMTVRFGESVNRNLFWKSTLTSWKRTDFSDSFIVCRGPASTWCRALFIPQNISPVRPDASVFRHILIFSRSFSHFCHFFLFFSYFFLLFNTDLTIVIFFYQQITLFCSKR